MSSSTNSGRMDLIKPSKIKKPSHDHETVNLDNLKGEQSSIYN